MNIWTANFDCLHETTAEAAVTTAAATAASVP